MPRFKYYESYSTDTDPYPEIREILDPRYERLPPEDIEAILENANIDPEYMENFLSNLGKVGGIVGPALPAVGTAVGAVYGGPAGAAIGRTGGLAAAGALGGTQRPGQPPPAPQTPPPGIQPAAQIPGAPPAADQLLRVICHPETLKALIIMLLAQAGVGQAGARDVPVGPANTPVPPGAFTNMISTLANQASAEYNAAVAANGESIPEYLLDFAGQVQGDIAVPEYRAERLCKMLQEADYKQDEYYREDVSEVQQLDDWVSEEMALVQLYSDYAA